MALFHLTPPLPAFSAVFLEAFVAAIRLITGKACGSMVFAEIGITDVPSTSKAALFEQCATAFTAVVVSVLVAAGAATSESRGTGLVAASRSVAFSQALSNIGHIIKFVASGTPHSTTRLVLLAILTAPGQVVLFLHELGAMHRTEAQMQQGFWR